jgi:hypothetical protein
MSTEPNSAQVFAGPVVVYLAPGGTAPPSLAAQPTPSNWLSAGFSPVGYTDTGAELVSTPAQKDVIPDEVISPVLQIITSVKAELKVVLLEATIENLNRAIGLTQFTNPGLGIKTLGLGSGNPLVFWRIGLQGPSPGGAASRVILAWRTQVISAVTQSYSRKTESKLACAFSCLSDSSQPVGQDVWLITDFGVGS